MVVRRRGLPVRLMAQKPKRDLKRGQFSIKSEHLSEHGKKLPSEEFSSALQHGTSRNLKHSRLDVTAPRSLSMLHREKTGFVPIQAP